MGEFIVYVIVLVPIGLFFWHQIYNAREKIKKNIAATIDQSVSLEEDTRTLVVHQLHPLISNVVTMERYRIIHTGYQPETYTFTSVTVGNVTTGGVSKEEAYTYISGSSKTDKYELLYLGKAIRKIKLCSEELIDKAKRAGLDKYMNNAGEIVVVGRASVSRDALESALSGHYTLMQLQQQEGQPDYGKCRSILDFLTSTKGQSLPQADMTPEQKSQKTVGIIFLVVCLIIALLVGGVIGWRRYEEEKEEARYEIEVLISGLEFMSLDLPDPAALGLEGYKGYCQITESGELHIRTWSETDKETVYKYKYTIQPKKLIDNTLYFDLVISENSSHGDSTSPESITRLTLTFREESHREYTDLKLLDSSGNIVASSYR